MRQPLVVLLDDLHWADPASLDLVRFIARALSSRPLLLIGTYRTNEITDRHPLYTLLPVLIRESNADRLDLQPLPEGAVRALVTARYHLREPDTTRLVTYLQERAEGNPFFLHELLHTLEEEAALNAGEGRWTLDERLPMHVPMLVRQVIGRRLAHLGDDAQHLLGIAAVIGQEVPLALWAIVAAVDEEALLAAIEQATEARLLESAPDGTTARFTHALIRQTLYENLLPPRRRIVHRQIAEQLEMTPLPDPDAVAYHFRRAGDTRAVSWLVVAANRAQRAYAFATAVERLDAALTLLEQQEADPAERALLLLRRGSAVSYFDAHEAVRTLDKAIALAIAAKDLGLSARIHFHRGVYRYGAGSIREGLAETRAGLFALDALSPKEAALLKERLEPFEVFLEPLTRLAGLFAGAGYYIEAGTLAKRALAKLTLPTTRGAESWTYTNAIHGLIEGLANMGHPKEAHEAWLRSLDAYHAIGYAYATAQGIVHGLDQVLIPYYADHLAERRQAAEEAEEAFRQSLGVQIDLSPRIGQLAQLSIAGQWDEAHQVAVAAHASGKVAAYYDGATQILGLLALARGETERAWRLVRETLREGPLTEPGDTIFGTAITLQRVAATLALDAGDLASAWQWLEAHDRWLAWNGAVLGQSEGEALRARYYRAAGDVSRADYHAMRSLDHAAAPRQPLALVVAHRLLGQIHTDAGRFAEATVHLDASLALADACATPYERALTLLARAELAIVTGSAEESLSLLNEARRLCVSLGARPAIAQADLLIAWLSTASVPPTRYPDHLTQREVDVLSLLASGKTNREMGEALCLSARTIERHIANIYVKVGAHGRADAAAYAVRHHIVET